MKKTIIANWKMNLPYQGSVQLAKRYSLSGGLRQSRRDIIVCPDYLSLPLIAGIFSGSGLKLGAQDCAAQLVGPHTGEVSAKNLKTVGVKYVLLGHSERRQELQEDSALVAVKLVAALEAGLRPILCLGETAAIKAKGQTRQFLGQELKRCLANIKPEQAKQLLVAYEPVWAISTSSQAQSLDPQVAAAIHKYLEDALQGMFGRKVPVLYGGSVTPQNAGQYLSQSSISGLLIGGASLRLHDFESICQA